MYPVNDPLKAAKVDQFIDAATDITNLISPTVRMKDAAKKLEARTVLAQDKLPRWLGYLERLANQGDATFLVGDSMTIADLAIWRLVAWLESGILDGIPTDILMDFDALSAHRDHVGSHS